MRRGVRRVAYGVSVAGLLLLGVLAQATDYLLELTSVETGRGGERPSSFAENGPHVVGVRSLDESAIPLTAWYPSVDRDWGAAPLVYAYGVSMFGSESSLALGTYEGRAKPGAPPDLATGPYPLVVLSPGFAITSSSYAWLAEHLASHGFVVLSPNHRESLDPRGLWRSTIERPRDILTVLAYVEGETRPGGELEGLIDNREVAVIGHSYGGYTALAAAGARLDTSALKAACGAASERNDPVTFQCDALLPHLGDMAALADLRSVPADLWPARADERIDAIVAMAGDAIMFGRAGLAEITVPLMAIGGTADIDSPFVWGTELAYEHVSSSRKVEIALEGAAHFVFAGGCDHVRRIMTLVSTGFCSDPSWDRHRAQRIVRHEVTAFLMAELRRSPEAAAVLGQSPAGSEGLRSRAEGY